jgi:membrane-bound serine protease (ClpP class)
MKNPLYKILVVLLFVLLCGMLSMPATGRAGESNDVSVLYSPTVKVAVIPCEDMIDDGLYKSIKRRTEIALNSGAQYLIYQIDTYGGDLFAAFDISNYFLHEVNPKVHTVAYVSQKAISAGAMISVACKDIIMKENTTIGDCAPIQMGGKLEGVEREKVETVTRSAFVNAANSNGYPEALLKAMVTIQIEVYKLKNLQTGKYEFFEGDKLPKDPNIYDINDKEIIDRNTELLTLTASQAVDYGVARVQVKDLAGGLEFLAKRDNVIFAKDVPVLKTNWSGRWFAG